MEKPKCRLCGERHYAYEPHSFQRGQPVTKTVTKTKHAGGRPKSDNPVPATERMRRMRAKRKADR